MRTLALNLFIAVIWLLLSEQPSLTTFWLGFGLGFGLIALFRRVLPRESYVARVVGVVGFVVVFAREFVLANVDLLRTVFLQSREDLEPNLITMDVSGLTKLEILLLTYCISLTPGSVTVQIEPDFQTLVVHALNGREPEAVRRQINDTLRRAILGFTRG
jgi:multisubunit Na+/H+ antiporter MnhE subunit